MAPMLSRGTGFLAAICLLAWIAAPGYAAVVVSKHGEREGQVIVREFEQMVITIVTETNRIFQFYARDVQMVTASAPILLATDVHLIEEPDEESEAVIELYRGTQIAPQGRANDDGWIRVRAWGGHEGWMPASLLTDRVEFGDAPPRVDHHTLDEEVDDSEDAPEEGVDDEETPMDGEDP